MEKYKFNGSPAPWTIEKDISIIRQIPQNGQHKGFNAKSGQILDANNLILGEVRAHDTLGFTPLLKAESNASLIISAPLLLSALIKAVEYEESVQGDIKEFVNIKIPIPDWYHEAKQAIESALNIITPQP